MEQRWYAAYTKPRWEKKVSELLTRKNITNYCPLNKIVRQWHDRKKVVLEPVFTSYVFIRITEKRLPELKKSDGIISIVHWLGKPAIIKDDEIDAIRSFLSDYDQVILEKVPVKVNETVRIIHGPLTSLEGVVVGVSSNTVKLLLPSMGFLMLAQVQRTAITKEINVLKLI